MAFRFASVTMEQFYGPIINSACVVYTKTIIHLSICESGGYSLPLR